MAVVVGSGTVSVMACADRLVVLLKAPRPGQVKTRLAAGVGVEAATEAYRQLLTTVLDRLAGWPEVELRHAPDDAAGEVAGWCRPGWTQAPQGPGDLGIRLARTMEEHFRDGAARVVVIGADCPHVTVDDLRAALAALEQDDVVLGPASDGGYWLVGLKAPWPVLFEDIAWSTAQVLAQTEARAAAAGLRVTRLRVLDDVDTAEDWARWQASAAGS